MCSVALRFGFDFGLELSGVKSSVNRKYSFFLSSYLFSPFSLSLFLCVRMCVSVCLKANVKCCNKSAVIS